MSERPRTGPCVHGCAPADCEVCQLEQENTDLRRSLIDAGHDIADLRAALAADRPAATHQATTQARQIALTLPMHLDKATALIARALTDARREAFVDGFNAGLCGIDKFGEQHETAEEGYEAWLRQRAAAEE